MIGLKPGKSFSLLKYFLFVLLGILLGLKINNVNSINSLQEIHTPNATLQTCQKKNTEEVNRLLKYVGKYPMEFFEQEKEYEKRLRAMLGSDYRKFKKISALQTPIKLINNKLIMDGCIPHDCPSAKGLVAITLSDQKLHCLIRYHIYDSNVQGCNDLAYSENIDTFPTEFKCRSMFSWQ